MVVHLQYRVFLHEGSTSIKRAAIINKHFFIRLGFIGAKIVKIRTSSDKRRKNANITIFKRFPFREIGDSTKSMEYNGDVKRRRPVKPTNGKRYMPPFNKLSFNSIPAGNLKRTRDAAHRTCVRIGGCGSASGASTRGAGHRVPPR